MFRSSSKLVTLGGLASRFHTSSVRSRRASPSGRLGGPNMAAPLTGETSD